MLTDACCRRCCPSVPTWCSLEGSTSVHCCLLCYVFTSASLTCDGDRSALCPSTLSVPFLQSHQITHELFQLKSGSLVTIGRSVNRTNCEVCGTEQQYPLGPECFQCLPSNPMTSPTNAGTQALHLNADGWVHAMLCVSARSLLLALDSRSPSYRHCAQTLHTGCSAVIF